MSVSARTAAGAGGGSGGWTVAETANIKRVRQRQEQGKGAIDLEQGGEHNEQALPPVTSPSKNVRWSDSFDSKSQEDLDKLLDGLDRLTETLPDIGGGGERQRLGEEEEHLFEQVDADTNTLKNKAISSSREEEGITELTKSVNSVADVISRSVERNRAEIELNSLPSVKHTRQLLQSRETYLGSPDMEDGGSVASAGAAAGPIKQPYHTLQVRIISLVMPGISHAS